MHQKTRRIALLGLLFAVSLVLSFLEGLIPPLPAMPPGVKLGLANIVVMYSLICLDFRSALTLTALKGLSAFLMRGAISACMSLAGSLVSALAMEELGFGIIDGIIPEPKGGAHTDPAKTCIAVKEVLVRELEALCTQNTRTLLDNRYQKYRSMGVYSG